MRTWAVTATHTVFDHGEPKPRTVIHTDRFPSRVEAQREADRLNAAHYTLAYFAVMEVPEV